MINVLLESDGGRPCLKEPSVVLGMKTKMIFFFFDPANFLASNCVLGPYCISLFTYGKSLYYNLINIVFNHKPASGFMIRTVECE